MVASLCPVSWLFSAGVRMIPGQTGQSSGGEAEQVTVFRYWVGMSDFSGEIRKKLEVSVPCLCCAAATLKLSVMSGDVSPETKATKSQNETLALWFVVCLVGFFNLS